MEAVVETLTVNLAERSYPIHVGAGLLTSSELFVPHIAGRRVMIVTHSRFIRPITPPPGEQGMATITVSHVLDALMQLSRLDETQNAP